MTPYKNHVNEKFGNLTAIETGKASREGRYWICLCTCGSKTSILGRRLRAGKTIQCIECYRNRATDWTGYTVGDLTVEGISHYNGGESYWKCQCVCGETSFRRCGDLKHARKISCNTCRLQVKKNIVGTIPRQYWRDILDSSLKRSLVVTITPEYINDLLVSQNFKCALSDTPICFERRGTVHTASLDRIDSSVGYVVGNVQWVHKIVNAMKMALPEDTFIKYCKAVANAQQ